MKPATADELLSQLDRLRAELADLAFSLEAESRFDAADVAIAISARVGELRDEPALAFHEQGHDRSDRDAEREG